MFAGVVDAERVPLDEVIRITLRQPTAQHGKALTTIARARHYHSALEWDSALIALRRNEPRYSGFRGCTATAKPKLDGCGLTS
ncbi:MAG TPA: hypothetical protein VKA25_12685, partial [Gemmatimonadales bacterium]|nr:hypothetical protein [Gemmatimonadales bacterium]